MFLKKARLSHGSNIRPKMVIELLAILLSISLLVPGFAASGSTQEELPGLQLMAKEQPITDLLFYPLAANHSVSFDINPSISLTVVNGFVGDAVAYNDDGQNLLDTDVVGLDAQQAISIIIESLVVQGYIAEVDDSDLIVTVLSDNGNDFQIAEQLKEYAEAALEGYGMNRSVKSMLVTSEMAEQTAVLGLSVGRFVVLDAIARQEGISLGEVIEQYSVTTTGDLMDRFEYIEDLFDDDTIEEDEADDDRDDVNEDENKDAADNDDENDASDDQDEADDSDEDERSSENDSDRHDEDDDEDIEDSSRDDDDDDEEDDGSDDDQNDDDNEDDDD